MLLVVSDEVITEWDIPQVGGGALSVSAVAGAITFIVGPNGSGKSSLGQWLETRLNPDQAHRVIAHRRLWMEGPGPAVTPAQRVSLRSNITQWDRMPDSRWLDHANHQRTDAVLFDLMSRENARNARAVRAYEAAAPGTPSEEIERSFLDRINTILSAAELPIEISLTDEGTFHAHSFGSGASYPVSELSDGEKSALLLAAEVLVTAAPIFIIDEPERHLHRSISAGLIAAVLAERTDCHFAVLTHDLDLASAVGGPRQLLLLTGCEWTGKSVAAWDIRAVSASEGIPDSVRRAVLGGKRQILFVEGEGSSLDAALYSILFPAWEIVPRGGCAQIQSAVSGLSSAADFHWVDASGIVDRDGRENDEITSLADQGVLVLGVHEIESVYYLPQVFKAVAVHQAANLELNGEILTAKANEDALAALAEDGTPERLAVKLAAQILARRALRAMPREQDLTTAGATINLALASPYADELSAFKTALDGGDLAALVSRFPVRETALSQRISSALRYKSLADYQAAVRRRLAEQPDLAGQVRKLIGDLPNSR
jgi:energy-coupling factor transporter ATP-binding protein EcfA2